MAADLAVFTEVAADSAAVDFMEVEASAEADLVVAEDSIEAAVVSAAAVLTAADLAAVADLTEVDSAEAVSIGGGGGFDRGGFGGRNFGGGGFNRGEGGFSGAGNRLRRRRGFDRGDFGNFREQAPEQDRLNSFLGLPTDMGMHQAGGFEHAAGFEGSARGLLIGAPPASVAPKATNGPARTAQRSHMARPANVALQSDRTARRPANAVRVAR